MGRNHSSKGHRPRWLSRRAGRLLAAGHMGILFCLCLLWILWDSPLQGEALLYGEAYIRSVGGFCVILWGVALGMDWLERLYPQK